MNVPTAQARRPRWWLTPATMLVLGSGLIVASSIGGSYGALPGEIIIVAVAKVLFAVLGRQSRSDVGAIMGSAADRTAEHDRTPSNGCSRDWPGDHFDHRSDGGARHGSQRPTMGVAGSSIRDYVPRIHLLVPSPLIGRPDCRCEPVRT